MRQHLKLKIVFETQKTSIHKKVNHNMKINSDSNEKVFEEIDKKNDLIKGSLIPIFNTYLIFFSHLLISFS